jgi:hypothetical protein
MPFRWIDHFQWYNYHKARYAKEKYLAVKKYPGSQARTCWKGIQIQLKISRKLKDYLKTERLTEKGSD